MFSRCIKEASREKRRRSGSIAAVAEESLGKVALVQAYSRQASETERFHRESLGAFAAQMVATRLRAMFGPFVDLLLAHLLDEVYERLAAPALAHLGRQLCSAARYLHDRGRVHLDIKPSNIISCMGVAKLLDLGLTRRPGPCPSGVGTARYLAPEQARGEAVGPATDAWGIGLVLYEAATGHRPFPAGTDLSVSHSGSPAALVLRYPQLVRRGPADPGAAQTARRGGRRDRRVPVAGPGRPARPGPTRRRVGDPARPVGAACCPERQGCASGGGMRRSTTAIPTASASSAAT